MCLVLSWKTGLDAICKAVWLSQMSFICSSFPNLNSRRRCFIHMSSHVIRAIARYSASVLDLTTTSCFLLFQDIRLPLIKTQYPEVERLSVGEPAQFASTNNLGVTYVLVQHTLAGVLLIYRRMRITASQWLAHGDCRN